jgi:hypothetical protein
MNLAALLVFLQAAGALTGAVSAVLGELAFIRAMRDGHVDRAERAHLDHIARGLRFGMLLLLLASCGLVVLAYHEGGVVQPALTASYWTLIVLALLVVYASWALSRGRLSFSLGSAIVFTGWWFLSYLALGLFPVLSFGAALAFYVVSVALFYTLLKYARFLTIDPKRTS